MHVGRRVYVSNLAWRTSWQDLKDKCADGRGWGPVQAGQPMGSGSRAGRLGSRRHAAPLGAPPPAHTDGRRAPV